MNTCELILEKNIKREYLSYEISETYCLVSKSLSYIFSLYPFLRVERLKEMNFKKRMLRN